MFKLRVGLLSVCLFLAIIGQSRAGEVQELAAKSRPAVVMVMVGSEDSTGFLITTDPPLVATVAHAVTSATEPSAIIIRLNETGEPLHVRAVHIHAGYKRDATPKDPYSSDVAILELEATDTELGQPLVLSAPQVENDLRGLEVIALGFPTYATLTGERESAESVIRHGFIQRLIDFDGTTTTMPPTSRPMLEHTFEASPGESGMPVLDVTSGLVVAIHHGTRRLRDPQTREVRAIVPVCLRIDLLWELIDQAGLGNAVPKPAS